VVTTFRCRFRGFNVFFQRLWLFYFSVMFFEFFGFFGFKRFWFIIGYTWLLIWNYFG
jgi:hypothetical protein